MKRKASRSLASATGLAVALVVALSTLPVVNARDPGAVGPAAARAPLGATDAVPGEHFVHVVTSGNTIGDSTYIDHSLTNDNPNAIVFATQNYNPGGGSGIPHDHVIGVRYHGGVSGKWVVFNQDGLGFTPGAAFNVLIPDVNTGVFVHEATVANSDGRSTYIDHPLTNGNPDAIVFAILNANPGGGGGVANDRAIAVFYNPVREQWAVFNQQEGANMPPGTAFNVLVHPGGPTVFAHRAGSANPEHNWTIINHPLANDNPGAIVFVTQNFNPGGGFGVPNDQPIGVYYNTREDRWAIFNQDQTVDMPPGAAFSVMIMGHMIFLPIIMR